MNQLTPINNQYQNMQLTSYESAQQFTKKMADLFHCNFKLKISRNSIHYLITMKRCNHQNEWLINWLFKKLDYLLSLTLKENKFSKIYIIIDSGNNERNLICKSINKLDCKYIRHIITNNVKVKITLY